MIPHRLGDRAARRLEQPERLRDRRQQQRRIVDGLERDEPDTVRKLVDELGGRVEREPCLPGAARPRERHEPDVVAHEQCAHGVELRRATDDRRRLDRQVRRPVLECLDRRELACEAGGDELMEVVRAAQVLEAVVAEVARLDADEVRRRLRQQHLASVCRRADPRRAVDVEADVVAADERRLSGVDSHPDAERQTVEGALPFSRGGDGVVGAREGEEQRVALARRHRVRVRRPSAAGRDAPGARRRTHPRRAP